MWNLEENKTPNLERECFSVVYFNKLKMLVKTSEKCEDIMFIWKIRKGQSDGSACVVRRNHITICFE